MNIAQRRLEANGGQLPLDETMAYADYLCLDAILTAQSPLTDAHDEVLFIIQHQVSEMWMRLAIHELIATCSHLAHDNIEMSLKTLSRVLRIHDQLNSAWDVLRTMTPGEFMTFRPALGKSSGFQSYQYRAIEFLAGNKNTDAMLVHVDKPEIHGWLDHILHMPSIYDQTVHLLARKGFRIDQDTLNRDCSRPYEANESVKDAWLAVYRSPESHWSLYELAEKLVDFEDRFRLWRFNHVTTVERMIGFKIGTGGTAGANYLRKMLDILLFPELWALRTAF